MPLFDVTAPGDLPDWNPESEAAKSGGKPTRTDLATDCQIGSFRFTAQSCSGGGERRLAGHGGIGVDGQIFEDLGENARPETLTAELHEWQWIELENLRRAGKKLTVVHPLFGLFQGRIKSCPYTAGINDMLDVQIHLVEDGDRATLTAQPRKGLPGAAQGAKGAAGAFDDLGISDKLGALDGVTAVSSSYDSLMGTGGAWDEFETVLDLATEAGAGFRELGAAFGDLVDAGASVIEDFNDTVNDVTGLVETGLVDATNGLLNAARECVTEARDSVGPIWRAYTPKGPASIASLAREWLGDDSDEAIDLILAGNPKLIDLVTAPKGVEILRPVL